MDLGFKLDLDVAASASQGGRIETGVYAVEIVKAYVYKTENGNNIVDLELRSDKGEVGFINRLCIDPTWESGSENFDYKRWQELAGAASMQTLTTFPTKRKTGAGEIDILGIKELTEKHVKVAVYEEFDVYNNEKKVSLKLSNTFLKDGRSVAEAQAKQLATRIEKVGARLERFETPAYKAWKTGGASAIDSVGVEDMSAPVAAPMAEEAADDLFG